MNFALITEGPSEHKIIKHIVVKLFKEKDPDINQLQPKIVNDRQEKESAGGWHEVLKYCERDDLQNIFIDNDYLIVQIDSDQSQTKPFNISHTKPDNELKTVDELHADIIEKLMALFKPEIIEAYGNKIFFAICIHTIECWLLPIYYNNNHKSDTRNCLDTLNKELRKKDIHIIATKEKNNLNSRRTYEAILGNWRKKQDIIKSAQHNDAFKNFIVSLQSIDVSGQ